MKYHKGSELSIITKIWDKEIKDLIDYDDPDYIKTKINVNYPGILSRVDKKVIFTKNKDEQKPFKLLSINKNEEYGFYNIDCGNSSKDISTLVEQGGSFIIFKDLFFKPIKSIKETFYKLSQGDIIKIGKYYIKLLDMQLLEDIESDSDRSNIKKTMIRSSSYNSFALNGQEVIRGTFSPDINTFKKVNYVLSSNNLISQNDSSLILSNNLYANKTGNLSFHQKLSFIKNSKNNNYNLNNTKINKSVKPEFYLPRINSFGELFMVKSKQNINLKNRENNQKNINIIKPLIKNKKNNVCRICYGDDISLENPLICPCICKGSMKYIHYMCLKNWLNSKIESEMDPSSENDIISYNTEDLICELCKTKFPDYVKANNKLYNISFYKPKFQEFVVFESIKAEKNKNKYIHIVSLDNRKCINIGRSSECEFSIPELSISRFHALIHKSKGELYLEDNKSKFGTLILVQNNCLKMNDFIPLKLQIKNTYIKIKMKLPFIYSCCIANTNNILKNDYQSQNQKNLDVFSYFKIKENNEKYLGSENDEDEDEDEKENENDIKHITHSEIDKKLINEPNNSGINNESKEKKSDLMEIGKISVEKIVDNDNKIKVINIMSGEIKLNKKSKTVETNKTKKDNNDKSKNNQNENIINNISLTSHIEKMIYKNNSNNKNIKKEIIKNIINNNEGIKYINPNNSSKNTIKNLEDIKKVSNINLIRDNNNKNDENEKIKQEENKSINKNKKIFKLMKKIKLKKNENQLKYKEEYMLPNINNLNNKEIENILNNLDFKKVNSIHENSSNGLSPLSLQETNLIDMSNMSNMSNFISNKNKSNNKIIFNKYNFFHGTLDSISFTKNKRISNNCIEQSESLITPFSFNQKEKSENEKNENKEN